ncbi:MAG: UvrB/UvrC motif-containing protein [Planctomycetota bacterium]|nr:UvrB/UvrC motif-containing protein [Planctomycetota bacterium]
MKCENCEKRDAIVHLTEIRDGVKHEMHLCEQCAAAKGLPAGKMSFPIADLLAGIAVSGVAVKSSKKARETVCPACGITLAEFQTSGRFGCAEDYVAFQDEVVPLIEKIHDASQHIGKTPAQSGNRATDDGEIRRLQAELKKAVQREDYEKAAEIRDAIRKLESGASGDRGQAGEK